MHLFESGKAYYSTFGYDIETLLPLSFPLVQLVKVVLKLNSILSCGDNSINKKTVIFWLAHHSSYTQRTHCGLTYVLLCFKNLFINKNPLTVLVMYETALTGINHSTMIELNEAALENGGIISK